MSRRVTLTKHDSDLIEWLVKYFQKNSLNSNKFPADQNLKELLGKTQQLLSSKEG